MAKRADFVKARRETRRKQIFDGAVRVFAEKGYHAATTQEIAAAAGIAKGTLYEYIHNKEEILLLVIDEITRTLSEEIISAIQGIDDPVERMKRAVSVQLKFAIKYRAAARVMRHESGNLSDHGRKMSSESVDRFIETFRSVIDYGIRSGRFKPLDSRIAAEIFNHTCTIYFDYGDYPHQKLSLDDITDFILDNFIDAFVISDKNSEEPAS